MENDDLTVRVLIDIRDRLDQTNARLDQTNARLDHLREDLGQRIDETNNRVTALDLHLSTEITAVAGAVQDVGRLFRSRQKDQRELSDRVGRVERDLEDLKNKVG